MDFLAKTLGLRASIPYKLGDPIQHESLGNKRNSLWNIYDAVSDKDNRAVSVFEVNKRETSYEKYANHIRNAMNRQVECSIIPGVLKTIETIENDNGFYIITERIRKLSVVIQELTFEMKVLGIFQIATALNYIHSRGSKAHMGLSFETVFINDSMEWSLGGFENCINFTSSPDMIHELYGMGYYTNTLDMEPPELKSSRDAFFNTNKNEMTLMKPDSYLLGVFICRVLKPDSVVADLLRSIKIDNFPIKQLVDHNFKLRVTVDQYLKNGEFSYFASNEINAYTKFQEIALLDLAEKLEVYKTMVSSCFPDLFLENKVLADVVRTFDTLSSNEHNVQTILVYLMFAMVKNSKADSKSFELLFKPAYFKAFKLSDRSIRVLLLKILPKINDRITKHDIQDKIYPNLITGFQDTDVTVRTETLISISVISDKITDRQLNNDLLRFLAKLQVDPNPKLRANTVICLTKLAEKMQQNTRVGVLITAFGKALRDTDDITRMCAVKGFEANIDHFGADVCCSKVLSSLAPALLDKSSAIRKEAEKTFAAYMEKIKNESENIESTSNQDDDDLNSRIDELNDSIKNLSLETMSEGLLGSISNLPTPSSTPVPGSRISSTVNLNTTLAAASTRNHTSTSELDIDIADNDDDGWGFDDDADYDETPQNSHASLSKPAAKEPVKLSFKTTAKTSSLKSSPNPKKPLILGKKKPVTKLNLSAAASVQNDDEDDGWGDGW